MMYFYVYLNFYKKYMEIMNIFIVFDFAL